MLERNPLARKLLGLVGLLAVAVASWLSPGGSIEAAFEVRENPQRTAWVTGYLKSDGACDEHGNCTYTDFCCVEGGGTAGGQLGCAAIDQEPFIWICNYEPLGSCSGCGFIGLDLCTEGELEDQPNNLEAVNRPAVGDDARKPLVSANYVCGQTPVIGP